MSTSWRSPSLAFVERPGTSPASCQTQGMVLRAVAVGVALLLATGCVKNSAGAGASPLEVVVGSARAVETEIVTSSDDPRSSGWSTTDEVEVEWRGRWWPAIVMERRGGSRFLVHYTGYGDEWNEVVGVERVRSRSAPEPSEPNEAAQADADP